MAVVVLPGARDATSVLASAWTVEGAPGAVFAASAEAVATGAETPAAADVCWAGVVAEALAVCAARASTAVAAAPSGVGSAYAVNSVPGLAIGVTVCAAINCSIGVRSSLEQPTIKVAEISAHAVRDCL